MSHIYGGVSFAEIRRMRLDEYAARVELMNELLGGDR
jgi:hypothetical protein